VGVERAVGMAKPGQVSWAIVATEVEKGMPRIEVGVDCPRRMRLRFIPARSIAAAQAPTIVHSDASHLPWPASGRAVS